MTDDYPAVMDDEDEEQKKQQQYPAPAPPPAMPTDATAPMPGAMPAPAPSSASMPAAMPPPAMPAPAQPQPMASNPNVPPPAPPSWSQYAPPEPHGLAKVGHIAAALSPKMNEYFNVAPERRAEKAYGAATGEYEATLKGGVESRREASEEELRHAQAQQDLQRPATALDVAKVGAESKEKIAETAAGSREKVAETGAGSREKVAETNTGKAKYTDLEVNGKKVPGKVDAEGNLQLADGTPAPKGTTEYKAPTYAEVMGGRLTNIMVDGVPTQVQLQPQGGVKVIGESGTGQLASRIGQAKVVQSAGDQLIEDIKANKGKLGNMQAMVSAALLGTPWSDPETQQLYSEIGSYIALHPAMHGFRGASALEHFSNLIGGIPNNPEAMIKGIEGLSKMAKIFTEPSETKGGEGEGGGPPKPQSGMKVQERTVNGKKEYRQVPIGQ